MSKAHSPQNGDRDSQATLPELFVLGFGVLERDAEGFCHFAHDCFREGVAGGELRFYCSVELRLKGNRNNFNASRYSERKVTETEFIITAGHGGDPRCMEKLTGVYPGWRNMPMPQGPITAFLRRYVTQKVKSLPGPGTAGRGIRLNKQWVFKAL